MIMASGPIISWQIDGETIETVTLFWGAPKSLQMVTETTKLRVPWKKSYDQARQHIKKQRHYFSNKGPYSQSYSFSRGHVGPKRKLSAEVLMLLNCGVREDS